MATTTVARQYWLGSSGCPNRVSGGMATIPVWPPVHRWKMVMRSGTSSTRKNEVMARAQPPRRSPGMPLANPTTRAAAMATSSTGTRSVLTCMAK